MIANRARLRSARNQRFQRQQPTVEERMAAGVALRQRVPRSSHADWSPSAQRPDPINVLQHCDCGRLQELLPIRYGRMKQSPFGFYRGAASVMAYDLSRTPATGIRLQACGDCHAANFGGFASPERRLIFDINDFDETLPAPWEWDVKRLAASIVLGLREIGLGEGRCRDAVCNMAQSYREQMRRHTGMHALDVWYSRVDADEFIKEAKTSGAKKRWEKREEEARKETGEHIVPEITHVKNGRMRFADYPPLVYHRDTDRIRRLVLEMFRRYRKTLPEERRILLDRYQIVDEAGKVVGVGSVGTRCAIVLLLADKDDDPLLLQFKEAHPSVLESYAGKSRYKNHGERVVTGQRMLQAASDVFLGWTSDGSGRDYYFRQLCDMKMKLDLSKMSKADWFEYVEICGRTLARAQARAGDSARIAGYLGASDKFDAALAKFAPRYADQAEQDHAALHKAIRSGRVKSY